MAGPAYSRPPNVATLITNAVVASTNTQVIAAPGIGGALRIVAVQFGVSRAVTGIADLNLTDGAGGTSLVGGNGLAVTGQSNHSPPIVEPGIQLTVNTALFLTHATTVAAGQVIVRVQYYVDQI